VPDDKLDEAMKDLDMNNDGVIDLHEFSRWYYTGMKSYSDAERTFLKTSSIAASTFDSMSDDLFDALQQDLRTKKHSINVSFNDPGANSGTEISIEAHLVGSHYNAFKARMNKYAGTFDK